MAKNNIKSFKLDTGTYKFLGANEMATKKYSWENGKRLEEQATNDKGIALWNIVVTIVDDINRLTDTAMVTVASTTEPKIGFMKEISFTNLQLLATSRKEEFGVNFMFSAEGIQPPKQVSKAA